MAPTATTADEVFLDTNVLLAACDPGRATHGAALQVLDDWPNQGKTLCASGQVMREYLVVATRPLAVNGLGLPQLDALANARAFSGRLRLLEETKAVCDGLLALLAKRSCTGARIHDANIVATMQAGGIRRLITSNVSDFKGIGEELDLIDLTSVTGDEL